MSKNIKLNNTDYSGVSTVQLPTTDGGVASFKDTDEIMIPSGTKEITENGTFDVTNFASALVNVATGGSGASGGLPIHTGEQVVSNANTQHDIEHNLNLNSYICIYWLDTMADFIASTESTNAKIVSGIGSYNFDHFLESNGMSKPWCVWTKTYNQSNQAWNMVNRGGSGDPNKFEMNSTANITTGTYKYIIIDTTSLTGGE